MLKNSQPAKTPRRCTQGVFYMADDMEKKQQGGQSGQGQQGGQSGQQQKNDLNKDVNKNDPNKKGGQSENEEENDRQRRAS
jgi:hypothetical protein